LHSFEAEPRSELEQHRLVTKGQARTYGMAPGFNPKKVDSPTFSKKGHSIEICGTGYSEFSTFTRTLARELFHLSTPSGSFSEQLQTVLASEEAFCLSRV
jgi:hypothetical protein